METFLEFAKEVLKGIVRAISAFLFNKTFLEQGSTGTSGLWTNKPKKVKWSLR